MSTRPRFRLKEVLWLTLPIVLFIGAGAYFARREGGPWRIVVDEVKLVPVTPLDVFEGYDTKVAVKTHLEGAAEIPEGFYPLGWGDEADIKNARFVCRVNGREKVVERESQHRDIRHTTGESKSGVTISHIAMKLARLPAEWGGATLKFDVAGNEEYRTNGVAIFPSGFGEKKTAPVPVRLLVRKAGDKVKVPTVTKSRSFLLLNVGVNDNFAPPARGNAMVTIRVKFPVYMRLEDGFSLKWYSPPYIEEEGGKRYSKFYIVGYVKPAEMPARWQGDGYAFEVPLKQLPKHTRKLTFKMAISDGQCWPLPISVVVRDANGRVPHGIQGLSK